MKFCAFILLLASFQLRGCMSPPIELERADVTKKASQKHLKAYYPCPPMSLSDDDFEFRDDGDYFASDLDKEISLDFCEESDDVTNSLFKSIKKWIKSGK